MTEIGQQNWLNWPKNVQIWLFSIILKRGEFSRKGVIPRQNWNDEAVILTYFLRHFIGGKCLYMGHMWLEKLQMEGIC